MNYLYEPIEPTRLYIKQCSHCSLKYFGKTTSENVDIYPGSGIYWTNHLKKYNANSIHLWNSEWYNDTSICKFALKFSKINKIVESNIWANLKEENGLDGGWSYVHTDKIQTKARLKANKTLLEKYGVSNPSQIPHVREINKRKTPWNKGSKGALHITEDTRNKMSKAASERIQTQETKEKIKEGVINHNTNKGTSFIFIHEQLIEEITCLKQWCFAKGLDYNKVFSYLDKGPIKMIPRYDSPTRRWFLGKEIRRK